MLEMNHETRHLKKIATDPNYEHVWVYSLTKKDGNWFVTEHECALEPSYLSRTGYSALDVVTLTYIEMEGNEGESYGAVAAKKVWFSKPNKRAAYDIFVNFLKSHIVRQEKLLDKYKQDLRQLVDLAEFELQKDKENNQSTTVWVVIHRQGTPSNSTNTYIGAFEDKERAIEVMSKVIDEIKPEDEPFEDVVMVPTTVFLNK